MRFVRAILLVALCLIPCLGHAQGTGTYAFGPFDNYGFDSVNRGNLDVHFSIPMFSKPGRGGTDFHYALNYDGLIWTPQSSSGTGTWTPAPEWGWTDSTNAEYGYVTYHPAIVICGYIYRPPLPPQPEYQLVENRYVYHDNHGVPHSIPYSYTSTCGSQGTDQTSGTYSTSDNSGLTAYRNKSTWTIVNSNGTETTVPSYSGQVTSGSATFTDTNGNEISVSSSGTFTDTMGKTALTVSGAAPNPVVYTYTDSNGASQQVTVNYGLYTVQTDFGVNGITEYSGTNIPLVSSIVFSADGTSYSFAYEATPNNSAAVTGRIAKITLRTGGTIQYVYTGGNNGIEPDGTTAGLNRETSDGTIAYSRSNVTSSSSATTITDATQNQTVSQFLINSGYFFETDHAVYSGSAGGTPLAEIQTCYNTSGTCSGGSVSSSISSLQTTTLQNGIKIDRVYNTYTGVGLLQSSYDADTGITTSDSYNQYTNSLGIPYYRISSTSTTPQGQGVSSKTTYGYDETTPTATSGLPQHISVSSSRGNLTSVHQWLNSSGSPSINTTVAYDDAGQVLSQTDTNNDVTSYAYDSATDTLLSTVTYPQVNGKRFSASVQMDSNTGLLTSITDINGQTTSFSYDGLLRPTQVLYPDNGKTTYGYSQNQTSIYRYQNSSTHSDTEVLFDGYSRRSRVAVANGQGTNPWYQQDTCYDANGNVGFASYRYKGTGWGTSQVCSGSGGDTFSYDALHRLIKTTHGDNTVVTRSYTGTATETTDENGVSRIVSTMAPGLIGAVCEISSNSNMPGSGSPVNCNMNISGTGFLTSYAYDFVNHKVTITQGGQSRVFQNDWAGRPILVQEPESGQTTYGYAYNATGLVVTRQRPAANQTNPSTLTTTTTQYDALGRPTSISYSDGTVGRSYAYDASAGWGIQSNLKGRLSEAGLANGTAATVYGYDPMGRVTNLGECDPSNCGTSDYSTAYSYDYAGNLLTSTDGAGNTDTYTYSVADEVQSITSSLNDANHPPNLLSNVSYGPSGPTLWQLGNGATESRLYDLSGRVISGEVCASSACQFPNPPTYSFTAHWAGDYVTSSSDSVPNEADSEYYDSLGRLSSITVNGTVNARTYAYDRWGNRWSQSGNGPQPNLTFNTSNNQITTSGYAYDAAGNMTSDGTHTYTYDAEGNMTKVDNGSTNTFTYDALNQRVRIDWPWQGIEFVFNPAGQHTSSFNAANHAVSADWMFWGGSQFAVYSNSQTLFDHQDWLRTERMRTDAQGNVNGSFQSLPYGDGYTVSGNDWDQYHFAGMDQDSTSNDHAKFRGYSNMAGRWFSPDPYSGSYDFTNPQSLNRYAYVMNNPLSYTDPVGLFWACTGYSKEGGGWELHCVWNPDPPSLPTCSDFSDCPSPPIAPPQPPVISGPGGGGGSGSAPNNGQTWSQTWQAAKSCAASSFGLSTAAAGSAVASGLPVVSTAGKFAGMTAGTSVASQFFRSILPQSIGSTWAPTISNPLAASGTLGGVVGRWVPVIGEAVLIYQGANFVSCYWASDDNY